MNCNVKKSSVGGPDDFFFFALRVALVLVDDRGIGVRGAAEEIGMVGFGVAGGAAGDEGGGSGSQGDDGTNEQ